MIKFRKGLLFSFFLAMLYFICTLNSFIALIAFFSGVYLRFHHAWPVDLTIGFAAGVITVEVMKLLFRI